jgi:nucleotide-binding universal stress UspA family protein
LAAARACARAADLVIVSLATAQRRLGAKSSADLPYHLVRECGRPVVFLPQVVHPDDDQKQVVHPDDDVQPDGTSENFATRIIIAWDGGREATRAVRDALPILVLADDVIVLSVDSDRNGETMINSSREIARYLTAHGIAVRLHQTYVAHGNVGGTILSRAAEARSDLVIMGACAHPHALDISLGDTTRHVLDHMTVPVLMSC